MTSITIRIDDQIKNILMRKANMSGLTLSGYINLMCRRDIASGQKIAELVDEERLARELKIAKQRDANPNAKYLSLDKAFAEIDKEYGL